MSPSGVYWIDPDGTGSNAPFLAYGDMTTYGGGWTLAHSGQGNTNPSMDGHSNAIQILAQNQYALIRFEGSGINAFYQGHYSEATPTADKWTVLSGNASALYSVPWAQAMVYNYSVWVRETTTPVPSTVPIPPTVWLFGSGLIGLLGLRRRFWNRV